MILYLPSHYVYRDTQTFFTWRLWTLGNLNALNFYAKFSMCILLGNRCKVFFSFSEGSISPIIHLLNQKEGQASSLYWTLSVPLLLLNTSKMGPEDPQGYTVVHQDMGSMYVYPSEEEFCSKISNFEEN